MTLEGLLTEIFGPKGSPGRPVLVGPDCDNQEWFTDFWSELGALGRQPLLDWFTYHTYGNYDFMPACRNIVSNGDGPTGLRNATVLKVAPAQPLC